MEKYRIRLEHGKYMLLNFYELIHLDIFSMEKFVKMKNSSTPFFVLKKGKNLWGSELESPIKLYETSLCNTCKNLYKCYASKKIDLTCSFIEECCEVFNTNDNFFIVIICKNYIYNDTKIENDSQLSENFLEDCFEDSLEDFFDDFDEH